MSRASSDEQFQFLLSCIRYSNNGKVCTVHSLIMDFAAEHSHQFACSPPGLYPYHVYHILLYLCFMTASFSQRCTVR